jgi:hypothetical protein
MGHRRLAGRVTEEEIAGHGFLRIDVPGEGSLQTATQYYSPNSVYAITPTTEAIARRFAVAHQPQPVTRWELPEADEIELPYEVGVVLSDALDDVE